MSCPMEHQQPALTRRRPGWALLLTIALSLLFATGVGNRPDGPVWGHLYDVVLFNLPYLSGAGACFVAAARVRVERIAWAGMGAALTLSAVGNALRVLSSGLDGNGPMPLLADVVSLAGYASLYVPVIGLIRARVPRFHPSMWLDGVIGGLGSLAVGVAFLLGPHPYPPPRQGGGGPPPLAGPPTRN